MFITVMDEIDIGPMIKRPSGRRQKYVPTLIPFFASDKWKILQKQQKDGKVKLKGSRCIPLVKMQWTWRRSNWIRVDNFVRISVIVYSSRDPEGLGDQEHQARRLQGPDHLHGNVQWHWVENEWWKNAFRTPKNSGITQWNSRKDTGHFWVQDRKRNGFGHSHDQKEHLHSQNNGTAIQWNWPSCLQKKKNSDWNLEAKNGRSSIHFNGDFMNTELWFQTVCSVNQLSVPRSSCELVYQFELTEEEKGQVSIPVDNKILTMVEPGEVELLVSPRTLAPGNRLMQGGVLSFHTVEQKIQLAQLCEKALFQHLVIAKNEYQVRPNADDGWRHSTPFVSRELEFSILSKNQSFGSCSWRHNHRTFVNEIHDHKQVLRSSSGFLANLSRIRKNEERKVTKCHKETWASPNTKEASAITLSPRKASPFTNRTILSNEKKLKVQFENSFILCLALRMCALVRCT